MPKSPVVINDFTTSAVSHVNYGPWRHRINRAGRYFQVPGAHLFEPSPQRVPVPLQADGSPVIDPLLPASAMAAATKYLGSGITVSTAFVVSSGSFEDFIEFAGPELRNRGRIRERPEAPQTLRVRVRGFGQRRLRNDHPGAAFRRRGTKAEAAE